MKKKRQKKCPRCRKAKWQSEYNYFCTPCTDALIIPAYRAGQEYMKLYPKSCTAYIYDSRGRPWVYHGRGDYGGWRYNVGTHGEALLNPDMCWAQQLTFRPYHMEMVWQKEKA